MHSHNLNVNDDSDHEDDHGHSHSHQHGHSHRSGAATRYWREPKPLAFTILFFFVLLAFSYLRSPFISLNPSLRDATLKAVMPRGTRLVFWHDGSIRLNDKTDGLFVRVFENPIEPSCEFRNRTLKSLTVDELARVRFTYCTTMECLWTLAHMSSKETMHL